MLFIVYPIICLFILFHKFLWHGLSIVVVLLHVQMCQTSKLGVRVGRKGTVQLLEQLEGVIDDLRGTKVDITLVSHCITLIKFILDLHLTIVTCDTPLCSIMRKLTLAKKQNTWCKLSFKHKRDQSIRIFSTKLNSFKVIIFTGFIFIVKL